MASLRTRYRRAEARILERVLVRLGAIQVYEYRIGDATIKLTLSDDGTPQARPQPKRASHG